MTSVPPPSKPCSPTPYTRHPRAKAGERGGSSSDQLQAGAPTVGQLDAAGRPCVIDINPNPDVHPEAGFCLAAKSRGVAWERLAEMLLDDASLKERRAGRPGRLVAGREDRLWVQV